MSCIGKAVLTDVPTSVRPRLESKYSHAVLDTLPKGTCVEDDEAK